MKAHPPTSRSLPPAGILLALAVAISGCDPPTRWVERGIERDLHRIVGPADRYDVEIVGLRAGPGEADMVRAVGQRVRLRDAPVVDRIEVELHGLRYNRQLERVERVEGARATARFTPADIAAFLETQENIQSASVTLEQTNRATVRVRPALRGLALTGVTVDVTGQVVGAGSEVRFVVSDVAAAGVRLGDEAARQISQLINPLVDLSGIPIRFRVTDVRVVDGAIRLEATGDAVGLGSTR